MAGKRAAPERLVGVQASRGDVVLQAEVPLSQATDTIRQLMAALDKAGVTATPDVAPVEQIGGYAPLPVDGYTVEDRKRVGFTA